MATPRPHTRLTGIFADSAPLDRHPAISPSLTRVRPYAEGTSPAPAR